MNQIGPDGAEKIAEALKVNKTLTSIDLGGEELTSMFFVLVFILQFDVLVCEYYQGIKLVLMEPRK